MRIQANIKGISTMSLILLIIISAIIGGLISYAFTIAYYTKIPEETTLAITGVYINKENVHSFNVSILNPSYSPTNVTISRIAISLKNGTQLYDVVETNPSIKDGLEIRSGESLDITCKKIKKDNKDVDFGEFAAAFSGETIVVHVFAEGTATARKISAANMEANLPRVKLYVATNFNHRISFKKFNVTLTNSPQSEVNLTISSIVPGLITVEQMDPDVRLKHVVIPINESICFKFNGSWHGIKKITLIIYTEQGYKFLKEVDMETIWTSIQKVSFNESRTDHFNITVSNFAESAAPVNIERIECTLEDGTKLAPLNCGSVVIMPNSTRDFTFRWNWNKYRGKKITIIAYLAQEFETQAYVAVTPSPIIVKVLNAVNAFNLKDKKHFNITILNHASSLEAVNLTKIVVKETGQTLNGTKVYPPLPYGLIYPGYDKTFSCDFDWANYMQTHGRNLTLTLHFTGVNLTNYAFDFAFTLPVAELDVIALNCTTIGETRYLNLTVKNSAFSLCNLTLSRIVITIPNLEKPLEYLLPKNQTTLNVGSEIVLLCPFNWQQHEGKDVTIAIATEELVEASIVRKIP